MYRRVTNTFSADLGSPVQSRPADIAADPREEIEHHLPALRAFALVLAGKRAPADDMVAHTVVAARTGIDAYDRGTRLRVWLLRMNAREPPLPATNGVE